MTDNGTITALSFAEKPVDDTARYEVDVKVDEGDNCIDMYCLGEAQSDGTVLVRMSQAELIDLLASLTHGLHVATQNGIAA